MKVIHLGGNAVGAEWLDALAEQNVGHHWALGPEIVPERAVDGEIGDGLGLAIGVGLGFALGARVTLQVHTTPSARAHADAHPIWRATRQKKRQRELLGVGVQGRRQRCERVTHVPPLAGRGDLMGLEVVGAHAVFWRHALLLHSARRCRGGAHSSPASSVVKSSVAMSGASAFSSEGRRGTMMGTGVPSPSTANMVVSIGVDVSA